MSNKPNAAQSAPPTQLHLNIRCFVGDILVASDGTLAAVLEIEPVDLTMADPDEAAFVRSQFGRFVSSIRFPDALQIVMATYPQNLKAYLDRMRALSAQRLRDAEALRDADAAVARREARLGHRLLQWVAFIEFALKEVRPIENRYFVVVFHNPFIARTATRVLTGEVFDKAVAVLNRKLAHVQGELAHAGLQAREMKADEVAEIVYFFYHPVCSPLADQTAPRLRLMSSVIATGQGWAPDREVRPGADATGTHDDSEAQA